MRGTRWIAAAGRRAREALPAVAVDRDTAMMLIKTIVAATIAWLLAAEVFQAGHASFAPFSAVMLMQATISQSVDKSLRYTGAVVLGVLVSGVLVLTFGPAVWIFPVMLALALVIGRWRPLGEQGVNVAVAAIFAYGVFAIPTPGRLPAASLPEIAGMVMLGAGVALTVNLLIAPPLRYRTAADAVDSLCGAVARLADDMATGLRDGVSDADDARSWRQRAEAAQQLATQARSTVDHAHETWKWNPRRLRTRDRSTFNGYRVTITAAERIAEQLRSASAGLLRITERDDAQRVAHGEFVFRYCALLSAVRRAVDELAEIHTVDDLHRGHGLSDAIEGCRTALEDLRVHTEGHPLDGPTDWAVYGGLYTDAQRLCDDLQWARDRLIDVAAAVPPRSLRR
ncbi:hypothetical protein E4P42_21570 [Mycobacterium sp. PS03-16]|uniref:FUSC family protein n=1 Tax=Mycobacterium sp. PS03-16 TaxID=2559611 RepID=UPI001073E67F|nr:aromatic acid exporter family protein [Mycobacterium sp. PS03-16]TFV55815.1 hypothetical protein E4P42_21570 [Mycobacterium sp. PS03-16]